MTNYNNTLCDRDNCNNIKKAGTPTLWCDECNALPLCNEGCGLAEVDCDGYCAEEWVDESYMAEDAALFEAYHGSLY